LVNAEWQLSHDYRPRTALGSGEQVEVLLKADDLAVSWALLPKWRELTIERTRTGLEAARKNGGHPAGKES